MNIQWYPGHMTKTKRMITENISLVDIVIELVDARIPYSSKNPDIDVFAKNKYRIIILNKADLADDKSTKKWMEYFTNKGFRVILANSINGKGLNDVTVAARELMKEKIEHDKARGRIYRPIRAMIVGIPNVGKSTFINKFVGKSTAQTGDRPGVTKGKQWIKIKKDFELLDTPGILWPKFEDYQIALKLAFTGAIKDDIMDIQTLAIEFIKFMRVLKPETLKERYKIDFEEQTEPHDIFELIARTRGFIMSGNNIDAIRTAKIIFDEFRGGKLGRLTLELPENI
jgi:ribosome biogenesis GTPase A